MNEILKSEIFLVVYEKKEGVSLEEFGGLFRQVHGYYLKLSNYGYSSLQKLFNDMTDLVELKTINRKQVVRCRSPSRHHVVVSNRHNSYEANEQVLGAPSASSGPSAGPVVRKTEQAQPTPLQQNNTKVSNTKSATDKTSKETSSKMKNLNLPAKKAYPAVSHINNPQPINCGSSLNKKTTAISKTTKIHSPNPPISNPVHARPVGNVGIGVGAAKKNTTCDTRQECHANTSKPNSNRNVQASPNVLKTRVIESKACSATTGLNKKAALLPTSKTQLKKGPFDFNHIVHPGVQSTITYAAICKSNLNSNVNHNGQQFTSNNIRYNVPTWGNSTNVNQSYSRAEPRTSIHLSSGIKENIQALLSKHTNGLSIFQLQKLYLFTFRQPLKFKSSITLKQLLLELKDVVKTEGVGVQMLVFPAPAKNQQTTAANGDHGAALQVSLSTKNAVQEEVVVNPHSSGSAETQNDEVQEAAQLNPSNNQMLASGKNQMDSIKGFVPNVLKIKTKTPAAIQNSVKNIPSHAQHAESPREELSTSSDARDLPNHVYAQPPHDAPQFAQKSHQTNNSHGQEEISLCKNINLKEAPSKNGFSQNVPQASNLPKVILHSSGFSIVMGQQMDGPNEKINEMEKKVPYDGNNAKGPDYPQQMLSNSNSSVLLQDAKPQSSVLHVEDSEHLVLQPHGSINTIETLGQQPETGLQPETVIKQIGKPSSIQKNGSKNGKRVQQATHSSSNSQEITPNASSSEKSPNVQSKSVLEETSQQEASVFPPTNDLLETKTTDLFGKNTEGPEYPQKMLSNSNSSVLLQDAKPQLSVLHVENSERSVLQPHDSMNTIETFGQSESLALQPRVDFEDANKCNMSESPLSNSQDSLQAETVLVQMGKPSLIKKNGSKNKKRVQQAAYSSSDSQEKTTNATSSEKSPNVQSKSVRKETSQQEARVSSPTNDLGEAKTPYLFGKNTKDPEYPQQMLSDSNSSVLLQDPKPQLSVLHLENSERSVLQPHNAMNTIEVFGQIKSLALQPRVDFYDANKCNISESSLSNSQAETVLVQMGKPSSIQKHASQNRKKVQQVAYSSSDSQENTTSATSSEKSPNIQSKNVFEETSQQEARVLPPTNDLGEAIAHDLSGHSTEQATPMLSDEHTVGCLSLRPGQEIVDPLQNTPKQPDILVAQGDLQNGMESISDKEDMNTWQTSEGQICCIL